MKRLAAVDVGSTSVHLLVADASAGELTAVLDESAFLGLGATVDERRRLGAASTRELVAVLAGYAERAGGLGAGEIVALGTAPLRRAADGATVVRRVEHETGLALHVLAAREEALLTVLGATGGRGLSEEVALVDVGGGSTEVVHARADGRLVVTELDVGAARLAGRHLAADPPTKDAIRAMLADARAVVAATSPRGARWVVAVGGTAENLARVAAGGRPGESLSREELRAALEALGNVTADEAAVRFGIRPARARLLPPGAAILLALLDRWDVGSVRVSAAGVREGAILALSEAGVAWRDRLPMLACGRRGVRSAAPEVR